MRRFSWAVLMVIACHRPGDLSGMLVLAPGVQGDISGSRVELLSYEETAFVLVESTVSGPVDRFGRSYYEMHGLVEGPRFLRAWKDRDADGVIGDGDLVGVFRGRYRRGDNGESFWLYDDVRNEIEEIELEQFGELEFRVEGKRVCADSVTEFSYSFNHDVELTSLLITFPLLGSYFDCGGPGFKSADSTYFSTGWRLATGAMPAGDHRLRFRGVALDTFFDTTLVVSVQ